jgi:hypothetical protein
LNRDVALATTPVKRKEDVPIKQGAGVIILP